jgi:hypothetical protein
MAMRSTQLRDEPFTLSLRQLTAISALPEDWDSYGAATVTSTAVTTARALLDALSFPPRGGVNLVPFHVAPIPTGGVQLEWKRSDGAALELWIGSDGSLDAVLDIPSAEPRITEKRYASLSVAVAEIEDFVA